MKKRILAGVLACAMMTSLAACGSQSSNAGAEQGTTGETVAQVEFKGNDNSSSKVLIAYFSYFDNTDGEKINSKQYADAMASCSVTVVDGKRRGNNDIVADMLAEQTGADQFSILTSQKYSPDYDGGVVSQAQIDGKNKVKPELASHISNLDQYDTVILLFPTWWYDMPMAVYTFLDEYDLSGKTIAPIATSGGSGLVDTVAAIKKEEPGANVTDGLAIYQDDITKADPGISAWLSKIGISK